MAVRINGRLVSKNRRIPNLPPNYTQRDLQLILGAIAEQLDNVASKAGRVELSTDQIKAVAKEVVTILKQTEGKDVVVITGMSIGLDGVKVDLKEVTVLGVKGQSYGNQLATVNDDCPEKEEA